MKGIEDRELLEVAADVYDHLDKLVGEAHKQIGHLLKAVGGVPSRRALSCMEDTTSPRIAKTEIQHGQEVWIDEPPVVHNE
jgi:hypothetical protein